MVKNLAAKKKDLELHEYVEAFVRAVYDSTAQSKDDAHRIFKSLRFTYFSGAIAELTPDVTGNLAKLAIRAAKLLGTKAGNEKALRDIAMKQAQEGILNSTSAKDVVPHLIDKLFEEGNAKYEFLIPNYLVMFDEGVRSVEVGRVRALFTSDLSAEFSTQHENNVGITSGHGFSIDINEDGTTVTMHPLCWRVAVDATKENVEEEAKWLIDIAVSFLRLHFTEAPALFPRVGDVEPHPLKPTESNNVGFMISESHVWGSGARVPPAYPIGKTVEGITQSEEFRAKASLVFDPPEKSLAERFSQGLGWLTRGRQAKDRAERLLYFFTAIESLLSNDDKTAPIVQNIARQAAVILTNEAPVRAAVASNLKKLYALRSALVHTGSRAVLSTNANDAETLAESLFSRVLSEVDLKQTHTKFIEGLSNASYGQPWPENS